MTDEQQKAEAETQTANKENTSDGDKPQTPEVIAKAFEAREGLAKENEKAEQYLRELRELRGQEILGGKTDAGSAPEQKKEETAEDYAKRALSGIIK